MMLDAVEERLAALVPPSSPHYASLFEGARYSLLAPGKRIRPLMTLYTAEMLQKQSASRALNPACALEMVHCYSLIHDDLPCMDDDDFRRGKPTLHKAYTEAHAVLVGDYLLTRAFEMLADAPELSAEQKLSLTQTLARTAGSEGMIGGQVMDIEASSAVAELHRRKTAALFECAVLFGGIIAGATAATQAQLARFGQQFGELFQLADDIDDGDHPLGEAHAKEALIKLKSETIETLSLLPGDISAIKSLVDYVSQAAL